MISIALPRAAAGIVVAPSSLPVYARADGARRPALAGEIRADVAIVGGGLFGLSAALHLAERGRSVALVEAGRIADGASGRNGGLALPGFGADPAELVARVGEGRARRLWRWTRGAVTLVRALAARHAPGAALRHGVLVGAASEADAAMLRAERVLVADALDDASLGWLEPDDAAAAIGTHAYAGALADAQAAHLDPLAFARGLAAAAEAAGARLFEASAASSVRGGRVETACGAIRADHVVVAASGGSASLLGARRRRSVPVWASMIATARLPDALAARILPGREGLWDTAPALRYYRVDGAGRLLFGAGATGGEPSPRRAAARLHAAARALFPALAEVPVEHVWSGVIDVTVDGLPRFARAERVWSGHGFGGHGVALATGAGRALADAIAGDGADFAALAALPQAPIPRGGELIRLAPAAGFAWLRTLRRLRAG